MDTPDPDLFRQARTWSRPWPLSAVCLAGGLLLVGIWLLAARGDQARAFGPGYWPYLIVTTGTVAVALLGLWRGKRWAFFALPAALLLDDVVVWAMGELVWGPLLIQLAIVTTVWLNYPGGRARP